MFLTLRKTGVLSPHSSSYFRILSGSEDRIVRSPKTLALNFFQLETRSIPKANPPKIPQVSQAPTIQGSTCILSAIAKNCVDTKLIPTFRLINTFSIDGCLADIEITTLNYSTKGGVKMENIHRFNLSPLRRYDGPAFEEYCISEAKYLPASRDRTPCITCPLSNLCQSGFEEQVRRIQNGENPSLTDGCAFDPNALRPQTLLSGLTSEQKEFVLEKIPSIDYGE